MPDFRLPCRARRTSAIRRTSLCSGCAPMNSWSQPKTGSPAEEGRYKANVDVMMAIDALEVSVEMRPDAVILVTGDADFAYLAIKLRRSGIRVEVASVAQNLGNTLKSTAKDVIDLAPLFGTFELKNTREAGHTRVGGQAARSLARARDARATNIPDSVPPAARQPQQPVSGGQTHRRQRPRFRQPN